MPEKPLKIGASVYNLCNYKHLQRRFCKPPKNKGKWQFFCVFCALYGNFFLPFSHFFSYAFFVLLVVIFCSFSCLYAADISYLNQIKTILHTAYSRRRNSRGLQHDSAISAPRISIPTNTTIRFSFCRCSRHGRNRENRLCRHNPTRKPNRSSPPPHCGVSTAAQEKRQA